MAGKRFDSSCRHAIDRRQPHRWAAIRRRCQKLRRRRRSSLRDIAADRRRKELAMATEQAFQGIREAYTFDDVLLRPGLSDVMPSEADIRSRVTRAIRLNIPIIAS